MPCWTLQEMKVEFQAQHFGILAIALKNIGFNARIIGENAAVEFRDYQGRPVTIANGVITAPSGFDVDAIKRAYSEEIVKQASKRFGWTVKKSNTIQKKFVIGKR